MEFDLTKLDRCFQGIIPSLIATAAKDGTPNITYLSHVYYVDARHVALSCQFFNKTKENVLATGHARIHLHDPVTFQTYSLLLRYDHSETSGPIFDEMDLRIRAIASHTGMTDVFRLLSADLYEVLQCAPIDGFLDPPDPNIKKELRGPDRASAGSELRGLQLVSHKINSANDLDELLDSTLAALEEAFGFQHSMFLLPDENRNVLTTVASRGYGESGVGAEIRLGEGLIGTAAAQRKMMRLGGVGEDIRYGRAIRGRAQELGREGLAPEIPLPGLPQAQSLLVMPLVARDRLCGVLAVESRHPTRFEEWHQAYLNVIANQIAFGLESMLTGNEDDEEELPASRAAPPLANAPRRIFTFYPNDDCVFVDGQYLVRNIPGKILWKLLILHEKEARTEFSNRELRLDSALGLPPIKDNLESRLILLRRRLDEKCAGVRIVRTGRGRFTLEVDCRLDLIEQGSA